MFQKLPPLRNRHKYVRGIQPQQVEDILPEQRQIRRVDIWCGYLIFGVEVLYIYMVSSHRDIFEDIFLAKRQQEDGVDR